MYRDWLMISAKTVTLSTFLINSEGIIKFRLVGPITQKKYEKINLLINSIKNEQKN